MDETTCRLDGCGRAKAQLGWCSMHYQRVKKDGAPGPVESRRPRSVTGVCDIEGCDREHKGRGKCDMHIRRFRKNGDLGPAETLRRRNVGLCAADGCRNFSRSRGYCVAHYRQITVGKSPSPIDIRISRWAGRAFERDQNGNKQCRRCLEWHPETSFTKNQRNKDGLIQYCPTCTQTFVLRSLYGVTLYEYEALLAQQGGACAICRSESPKAGRRRFSIDHDHSCCSGTTTCGKCIRGLLCSSCNMAIGLLGDSVENLEIAAAYLRKAVKGE